MLRGPARWSGRTPRSVPRAVARSVAAVTRRAVPPRGRRDDRSGSPTHHPTGCLRLAGATPPATAPPTATGRRDGLSSASASGSSGSVAGSRVSRKGSSTDLVVVESRTTGSCCDDRGRAPKTALRSSRRSPPLMRCSSGHSPSTSGSPCAPLLPRTQQRTTGPSSVSSLTRSATCASPPPPASASARSSTGSRRGLRTDGSARSSPTCTRTTTGGRSLVRSRRGSRPIPSARPVPGRHGPPTTPTSSSRSSRTRPRWYAGRARAIPASRSRRWSVLVTDRDRRVRAGAATGGLRYPDDEQLLRLARDRSVEVRWAVLFRADRPRQAIELIAQDSDEWNRRHALIALDDERDIIAPAATQHARAGRRRAERLRSFDHRDRGTSGPAAGVIADTSGRYAP